MKFICVYLFSLLVTIFFSTCQNNQDTDTYIFETKDSSTTNINFSNKLIQTQQFNAYRYLYFFNGAGVGAADFNNDGWVDLFFAGNQVHNKLYLNQKKLTFKDVTLQSAIPQDSAWNTGVSIVDINNDGLLDIYICRVGQFEILHSKNQFLICQKIENGIPKYKDQAAEMGLDFSGFSTQSAFFDYDKDGDLDLFLLNHSVHQNGTFAPRNNFLNTYHPLSGDKLFRQESNGRFTDVTKLVHINSSAISYGLGIVISDINLDGYPDIYNGNDFHENDYLYINQKNGTFKDESNLQLRHTSQFTMGVDIADANNDGLPDILTMDMLPFDPYMLRRSLGEDDFEIYKYKIAVGYDYQYTRNTLQWNRGADHFSEIGLYAGIAATDWSWACFFNDFNNDGFKDIFVANGIPKRMNDIDYVNFISNVNYQYKIQNKTIDEVDFDVVSKFPEIKLPNQFFLNQQNFSFKNIQPKIKSNPNSFSNGAIYADLDNDGDEDIVVNNVNDPVILYENKSSTDSSNHFIQILLKDTNPQSQNINALGAKIFVYTNQGLQYYENYPVRGFMSSMQKPIHIGLGQSHIDTIIIVWDDNDYQKITNIKQNQRLVFYKNTSLKKINYDRFKPSVPSKYSFEDITKQTKLDYYHRENDFREFSREPLIPHYNSTFGPAIAVGDVNADGLDDVFAGGARYGKSTLYFQQPDGSFIASLQNFKEDENFEDVDAIFTDINNDHFLDLIVATGGNEFFGKEKYLLSKVYLNNGKGQFKLLPNAISTHINAKFVRVFDFNSDGWNDLFFGEKTIPNQYGQKASSFVLINNHQWQFNDQTANYAPELINAGMATDAQFCDLDNDKKAELVICYEWGQIQCLKQSNHVFKLQQPLTTKTGWWNFIFPIDLNKDGLLDFVVGNCGLNSRLQPNDKEPVNLYMNDFDANGHNESIISYYLNNQEIPFANKDELQKQIPVLKKKFLYAKDFAAASMKEIFSTQKLNQALKYQANDFNNAILINKGNLRFELQALPWQAQITSFRTMLPLYSKENQVPDFLLLGNFFDNQIQFGRYDADYGTLILNQGNNLMKVSEQTPYFFKGEIRKTLPITIHKHPAFIVAKNNDFLQIIKIKNQ